MLVFGDNTIVGRVGCLTTTLGGIMDLYPLPAEILGKMPRGPQDVIVHSGSLGGREKEDAAIYLINASRSAGFWTGISEVEHLGAHLKNGFLLLILEGLVLCKEGIYYPTPALVERLISKPSRAVRTK